MNAFRLGIGAIFAVATTFALLVLMYTLIAMTPAKLDESKVRRLADIQMPDTEIQDQTKIRKPDKPEKEDTPPELQPQQLDNIDLTTNITMGSMSVGRPDLKIGVGGLGAADGEYLPMVKVAPIYPNRALNGGIEGYCTVEYTVTQAGSVRDPVPVDCHPRGIFESASVAAANKFKYKPRVINGEPVEVAGVQNRFTYQLER